MKEIVLFVIKREGRNGDRATTKSPYKDYEIHVRRHAEQELNKDTLFETISGYDYYNSHIHDLRVVENEAFQRVRQVAQLVHDNPQYWSTEYSMSVEDARKSAVMKLSRQERLALGME